METVDGVRQTPMKWRGFAIAINNASIVFLPIYLAYSHSDRHSSCAILDFHSLLLSLLFTFSLFLPH